MNRRTFLRAGTFAGFSLALSQTAALAAPSATTSPRPDQPGGSAGPEQPGGSALPGQPGREARPGKLRRVISTHPSGMAANLAAAAVLAQGGGPIEAVQRGVMVTEADPNDTSVGYGGFPNAEGVVELDAAIMEGANLNAGAVAALRGIMHPVAVARKVMEETPHILLVGDGARRFALSNGFRTQNLLTPEAKREWKEWKIGRSAGVENHDTMGMIARDADGTMAAACTTSGMAWKIPGRVGDSPLVGHGLYCDETAGGACGTGIGEEVIKACGSYRIVEYMREGVEPEEAVRRVLQRIVSRNPAMREEFLGFVAMRADGAMGYASTTPGFKASVQVGDDAAMHDAPVL